MYRAVAVLALAGCGRSGFGALVDAACRCSVRAIPYDPLVQKILRVREDSGTMRWETSTDGVAAYDNFDLP